LDGPGLDTVHEVSEEAVSETGNNSTTPHNPNSRSPVGMSPERELEPFQVNIVRGNRVDNESAYELILNYPELNCKLVNELGDTESLDNCSKVTATTSKYRVELTREKLVISDFDFRKIFESDKLSKITVDNETVKVYP